MNDAAARCHRATIRAYAWWEMARARWFVQAHPRSRHKVGDNQFLHGPTRVDHRHRGVTTPNCDTLYSTAWVDLSAGPLWLEGPGTALPYWSIAVMDLHTDHAGLLGARTAAGQAQRALLTPPGWTGTVPVGVMHVPVRTRIAWLLGRYLTGDDATRDQADALRRAVTLRRCGPDGQPGADAAAPAPAQVEPVRRSLPNFLAVVNPLLANDPGLTGPDPSWLPPGLGPAAPPLDQLHPAEQAAWTEGFAAALQQLDAGGFSRHRMAQGAWRRSGTGIGQFGDDHDYRAETALWGLGALELHEAVYATASADDAGRPLDGSRNVAVHFPPGGLACDSFWSLTMYEVDPQGGLYFTENAIGRYAIGDRTPGLVRAADGSLTVHCSREEPADPAARANWLPAPAGALRLTLRAYWPRPELLDGRAPWPTVRVID